MKTRITNLHETTRTGNVPSGHRQKVACFIVTAVFALASCDGAAVPKTARLEDDKPANAELNRLNTLLAANRPVTRVDVDSLNSLRQKYPDSVPVRQLLQAALIKRGDWAAAEAMIKATDDGQRTDSEKINLAKIYLKQGKFSDAIDLIKKMAPAPAESVEVAALLGEAQFYAGNLEYAAASLEPIRDALIQQKRADDLALLGTIYSRRGEHAKAIDILVKAVEASPDNISAHNALARAYAASGEETRAKDVREKLLLINDRVAQTEKKQARMVSLFYQLEDAYAAKDFEKVIAVAQQLVPESDAATKPTVYQYLAAAYQAQGKETEALAARQEAAKFSPK